MNSLFPWRSLFQLPEGRWGDWLKAWPRCGQCATALRRFGQVRKGVFVSPQTAARYLHAREVRADFSELVLGDAVPAPVAGRRNSVLIEAELYCCHACERQQFIDRVKVFRAGRGWKEIKALGIRREIPAGQDLRPLFGR